MPTIITCGVYGFTEDTFEKAVVNAKPDVFVDTRVRRAVRGSQYKFANSQRLQKSLSKNNITYIHSKELAPSQAAVKREGEIDKKKGIARHDREELSDEFVEDYRRKVLDDFDAREFIESLGEVERVLIFCVETTPEACHRGLLADAIVDQLHWKREDLLP